MDFAQLSKMGLLSRLGRVSLESTKRQCSCRFELRCLVHLFEFVLLETLALSGKFFMYRKMFGFSRRRMKIGRLKVQLSDSAQGTPIRHPKRTSNSNTNSESSVAATNNPDEFNCQPLSAAPELNSCTSGNSENWRPIAISGDKPAPRLNHAAAVIGNKMVVVGGESGNGLLEDVQVLNFDGFSWTTASSKLYLSPTSLPLKIPACKGHSLVSWGKKVLLVGGKTDPASDRISVWAFDTETECWSLMEAKGDIPVARSGHTVVRSSSVLILFGGEDAKRRKLNDLHMFDLKSLTWLPLQSKGNVPSPRFNHVAALHEDKTLLIFGGATKSRTLNDLYSLDFDTMIWSRMKKRAFYPSPRAGCCGVLFGTKWYIAGGGSRKKRHAETLVYDILKQEWSVAVASPQSSITSNKGFSLVLLQQKERDFLVAFGGSKKEPSDQVEMLIIERNESVTGRRLAPTKDSVGRQNIASAIDQHGSGRRSLSESLLNHPNPGNVSLRKQLHNEDERLVMKITQNSEDETSSQVMEHARRQSEIGVQINSGGGKIGWEETSSVSESENSDTRDKNVNVYEAKLAALSKKNGILEGQLAVASGSREAAEKNLSNVLRSKQEMERKLAEMIKENEMLREKLTTIELSQEEANSLSNIVHSDNVRLEHDVAFLKAVLDDTQKELHSTRGVLAGERARAFQLQVEVFHLKQRLQSLENRAPTPRKPFHV
ncbi:Acyl-CoA-binding domain protein [Heracleum sosnowskyi]|uniref:Acyl-CoA-binding domain protein n=1 Tax=Heracleum sosnowskyi TaxID=360622 RepID=A0AAD8IMU1_9APIA|nr:Acyl-CoA-binding domain protein [Heracleum sosnowskyi]